MKVLGLVIAFLFCGCATRPPSPNPNVIEREIVKSVLSELCAAVLNIQGLSDRGNPAAVREHFAPNDGWLAAIETSLKTDIEGSASPSTTLVGPIIPGLLVPKGGTCGSYNVAAGGVFDQTATTLRDNKRYVVLDALMKDGRLCPQPGGEEFNAYFAQSAQYKTEGKYLAGTLGIRDWLWNGVSAQDFDSIAGPTTTIAEGPPQSDRKTALFSRVIRSEAKCPEGQICIITQNILQPWYVNQGQAIVEQRIPYPFTSSDGSKLTYVVTAVTSAGESPTIPGLTYSMDANGFIFNGAVSNTQTSFQIKISASSGKSTQSQIINVSVAAAPKQTSFGPTYGATFTFIIKATGQFGPSFSLDRVKGGGATLFAMTRTETSYVNIALTATGVPLVEVNKSGYFIGSSSSAPFAKLVSAGSVDKAISRLDDALLKLNLSHVFSVPQ